MAKTNVYNVIIEAIFTKHYQGDEAAFVFGRQEIIDTAIACEVEVPRNLGDLIYSFRSRRPLPEKVRESAPAGRQWVIRAAGAARYEFALAKLNHVIPTAGKSVTKILDSTPEIVTKYALDDEQALLAVLRYNKLVDIFTQTTCYLLQSHLRTTIEGRGQVETDELYVGVDRHGSHYAIPVQAKGKKDLISAVQLEQDFEICREKFPMLIPRPLAAKFLDDRVVALFEFALDDRGELTIEEERHYRLVSQDELSPDELREYARRSGARRPS